jgi:N6-L-threonylcarbamoyladenine synthase
VPEGQALADLCASFQEAVADSLSRKLVAAARELHHGDVVICGGVAANSRLRALTLERAGEREIRVHLPPPALCTDNGAMIAVAGTEAWRRGERGDGQPVVDAGWAP